MIGARGAAPDIRRTETGDRARNLRCERASAFLRLRLII